ncbi:MAG TPA: glycosyltransferase family 39 protein [Gemmataceae bacterium]
MTVDEGGHVLSGLLAWEEGRLDYCSVNPPLVKALVALPVAASRPQIPEGVRWGVSPDWVPQHEQFVKANRERYLELIFRARPVLVALSVLGGWLVYRWAGQLYGPVPGLVGLALWALCPNVLCWAGICTVDLGAAVFGLAAAYALRYYLHHPGWLEAVWAGWVLGLALLSKFTLLVLYPVFLIVWLVAWWQPRGSVAQPGTGLRWLHFAAILLVSVLVLNLGYGLEGTGRHLGSFAFKSRALSGGEAGWGNRFEGTWLEGLPVPLPAAYVTGLDEQKSHADRGFPAYLWGEWQHGGWWYYYLVAAAVKLPLGTWLLGLLALALACLGRRFRAPAWEEVLLWLPAVAIWVLLSSQTGINSHFRYVFPALPFLFIGISRVGKLVEDARHAWRQHRPASTEKPLLTLVGACVVLSALAWNGVAVARIHPHYLSYFNEVAGGPDNGWKWLAESNIDWGQDLLLLKRWAEEHPEARPLGLAYYGGIDPHLAGLDYRLAPAEGEGPRPGWYAVSVNFVCGASFPGFDEQGRRTFFRAGAYTYFRHLTPVAKAGYSIFIYHVTPEQAKAVRRELGLLLPPPGKVIP